MKKFLHLGPGDADKSKTTKVFSTDEWKEVRLDINKNANPDILGSMTDLSMIKDEEYHGIFSSHNLEHIYAHEVDSTVKEFLRVLRPDGEIMIIVPDLMIVAQAIVDGKYLEPLYDSPAGPISPIDILYGHRASIASGNEYMAHKVGYTMEVLVGILKGVGFGTIIAAKKDFNVFVLALKPEKLEELAGQRLKEHLGF